MSLTTAIAERRRAGLSLAVLVAGMFAAGGAARGASREARPTPGPSPQSIGGLVERAPSPRPFDYSRLSTEATELLSREIRIDTTNPPGDELAAAKLIKEKFLADGIPATVWEPAPGRGIVAARLHGTGHHSAAVVLLSHLDVVPANPKEWAAPPFAGAVRDGAVWGRGAIDDKGPGVIELMAMLAIKRSGRLLDRDVIFLATGDEETGGRYGAAWLVEHEPDVFADAAYLINQGGSIMTRPNGRRYYGVAVTEKTPLWIRLTAAGVEGEGATPPAETTVTHLVAALQRVTGYRAQIRIIDPVRDYYKALAELDGGPPALRDLGRALRDDPKFALQFVATPRNNALVRDTFTPTVLHASSTINLIPGRAGAEIDGRLLPGDDAAAVVENLRKAIADNSIRCDVLLNFPAATSPRNTRLMTAIEKVAARDHAVVVPMMLADFTDSNYFRQKGLIAYGFTPIGLTSAEEKSVHGVNERMPVKELNNGIRRMVELLEAVAH
ncbi:MAG TPA: M20/M25/M40 family metallo-hydrolase [Candidatus Binataceae bacterium]|nr:M20/M25/M40 family metallo-hydrolase [Candidatus Binataceae bacterium]